MKDCKTNRIQRTALPALLLACALTLCACSIAPRGRTVVMQMPIASPSQSAGAPGEQSFEIEKIVPVPLDKLDEQGVLDILTGPIFGWLDNDHLAAIALQYNAPQTDATIPQAYVKERIVPYFQSGALGYTSQIVSLDWQYGFIEPLLNTPPDTVIQAAGLSPDRTRAWYQCQQQIDGKESQQLLVTDGVFKDQVFTLDEYLWKAPFWSVSGNLLCVPVFDGKESMLSLYDVNGAQGIPYADSTIWSKYMRLDSMNFYGFDPQQDTVLYSLSEGLPATTIIGKDYLLRLTGQKITDYTSKATLLQSGRSVALVSDSSGMRMMAFNTDDTNGYILYRDVVEYAFSEDEQYICYARMTSKDITDIMISRWVDGHIQDEKLVLKGFYPVSGGICFSPESDKLFLRGKYKLTDDKNTALVLKFQ